MLACEDVLLTVGTLELEESSGAISKNRVSMQRSFALPQDDLGLSSNASSSAYALPLLGPSLVMATIPAPDAASPSTNAPFSTSPVAIPSNPSLATIFGLPALGARPTNPEEPTVTAPRAPSVAASAALENAALTLTPAATVRSSESSSANSTSLKRASRSYS